MSGIRERQTSPHTVAVVLNTPTVGSGMGAKDVWSLTGETLACLISPLSSSDDAAMAQPPVLSQKQTRTTYRVRFPEEPGLNPILNRLKVVSPAAYAGKLFRITQPVTDTQWLGRSFQCICEEFSQDRQTSPLMAESEASDGE